MRAGGVSLFDCVDQPFFNHSTDLDIRVPFPQALYRESVCTRVPGYTRFPQKRTPTENRVPLSSLCSL
jgi:hypothetical protein